MAQSIVAESVSVLVVDDEALIRIAAVDLAAELGFRVFEASNADDAIVILEEHPEIRIIFTDINMAGSMDGLELVAYAKKRWPPLKFVIVSGQHTPDQATLPPDSCFFAKPYDPAQVGHALQALSA